MDIKIEGKNVLVVKFGVKPYRSPKELPEKDPSRAELECSCRFTIKDVPDTFDLNELPKVILLPFVKSIVIDEQTTLRTVPKDKDSVSEYLDHYAKLAETCKKEQAFTVTEAAERKSTGGKVQRALDLVNAKQTALNVLVLKYTKYTAANLVEVMKRLEGCMDVESVKSTQLAIATEAEKSNRK